MTASNSQEAGMAPRIVNWFKKNFWGLVTIVVVTVVCVIIVQVFKKPGQMSVLESQAMDMTVMVPPKGAVPVGIAQVERKDIEGSVVYTGTVQAYEDEDIYPRVTGRIVKMPVYAGDRVSKGQLLVQLDPTESEYKAKQKEALFAYDSAMHNAGVAKSEFAQRRYELKAATEAEEAAQHEVDEAQASLNYWKPEVERERKLYEKQVVSLAEYQQEESFCKAAMAKTETVKAKLRQATNARMAAQSALDAMVHHVGHIYDEAKRAGAAGENATIYEKYTRIVAGDDSVVTKRVISPGVVVNPGMLMLKVAHIRQVRVQAEVASEDVGKVQLGDTVFIKGSPGSDEELKASVTSIFPAADPTSRTFTVEALVDNLVSTASRTGTFGLQQIKSMTQYRFLPGQYVVMKIVIGKRSGLVVPTSAIVWREGQSQVWKASAGGGTSGQKQYTCSMHPEVVSDKPGKCPKCGMDLVPTVLGGSTTEKQYTCSMHPEVVSDKPGKCPKCGMDLVPKVIGGSRVAQVVDVKVGLANPDETEVVSGLSEGDGVIYAGYERLQPGEPVVATDWGEAGPEKLPLASEVQGNMLGASNNWTLEQMMGSLMVNIALQPAKSGSNDVVVKVSRHEGGVVSGTTIKGKTSMPGMNMAGPDLSGTTGLDGVARLKSNFSSGMWEIKLSIKAPGQEAVESTVDVEVP